VSIYGSYWPNPWHDLVYFVVQTVESSLQHKVDMVSRLEHKTTQMAATIRDMEEGSVCHVIYVIFYISIIFYTCIKVYTCVV